MFGICQCRRNTQALFRLCRFAGWYEYLVFAIKYPMTSPRKTRKSNSMIKCTFEHVLPVKIRTSLCIRTIWLRSLLEDIWMAKDPRFLPADHEDSDQTARMHPRSLIGVFAGGIFSLVLTQKKKKKKKKKKTLKTWRNGSGSGQMFSTWVFCDLTYTEIVYINVLHYHCSRNINAICLRFPVLLFSSGVSQNTLTLKNQLQRAVSFYYLPENLYVQCVSLFCKKFITL